MSAGWAVVLSLVLFLAFWGWLAVEIDLFGLWRRHRKRQREERGED